MKTKRPCLYIFGSLAGSPDAPKHRFERIHPGQCDCDTFLGSRAFEGYSRQEVQKLREKGWSDRKIKLAEADMIQSRFLERRADGRTWENHRGAWMENIPAHVRRYGWQGLVLHEEEKLAPTVMQRRKHLSIAKLTPEYLAAMERDMLYIFLP